VSRLVVDCSVTGAWCLQDEHNAPADRLLATVAAHGGVVPALWPAEMANLLVMAERRGRIAPTDAERAVALLRRLPLAIDPADGETLGRTRTLAREHDLTAYDAWYLEVALRLALPLATFDGALAAAAERAGLEVATGG
jgi:predicted nucleic acid-binding protein